MAVWEQTEDTFAEAFMRSAIRLFTAIALVGVIVGPLLAGGWMANAYIVYRTSADELSLPVLEKNIPSPDEFISSEAGYKAVSR